MHEQHQKLEEILASFEQPHNSELQQQLQQWVAASEENSAYYEEVKRLWFTAHEPDDMEYDIETEKKRFWDQVDGMQEKAPVKRIKPFWKIAAAALILITAAAGIWIAGSKKETAYFVIETGRGQRDSVALTDGSMVILNGNSRVRYTTAMNGVRREIWLEKGEAFFDVHKDPQHPFVVHADTADIEVLGTSFDIRLTKEHIGVAVATGKVKFGIVNTNTQVLLTPGYTGAWKRGDKNILKTEDGNMLAWRTGKVKFSDIPLTDVFTTLEYMYNIEVHMQPPLKTTRATATIDNLSLEKMIRLLEASLNISIIKLDSITFKAQPVRM